jgi:predicted peptidase
MTKYFLSKRILFLLIGFVILSGCKNMPPEPSVIITNYNYFLVLPDNYNLVDKCPLILFLHGASGGSAEIETFKSYGLGNYADAHPNFPFVVLAPQSPHEWFAEPLDDLLNQICQKYKIDTERIYMTGFSLGGFGSFYMAFEFPERFAAIAPVCGWGWPDQAWKISHLPVWMFHNDGDPEISVNYSHDMYDALVAAGNTEVKLTIYDSDSHNAWTRAYSDSSLYNWFLSHTCNH